MSKTDQMRALREARFTRSSSSTPRRVTPSPATAPAPRSSRLAAAVAEPSPAVDGPAVDGPAVDELAAAAATEEVVADVVVADPPVVARPSFEVPTLDIPVPASVPRVREAQGPMPSAKASEASQAPASEQIVIPALDLTGTGPNEAADLAAPGESIERPAVTEAPAVTDVPTVTEVPQVSEIPASLGHSVIPGQSIAAYTQEDLVAAVRWVGRDAKPRDAAAMVRDVMVELGFKRRGTKITDAITTAAASIGALADESAADAPRLGAIAS
jgi:hypothetical protein